MISRLTQVEVDRGDGEMTRLDDQEIAGFAALLGGAGAETVTKLVGNATYLFHRYPDEYRKLRRRPLEDPRRGRGDPSLLPPSQYQGRFSVRESTFGGVTVPAGFPTILVTGSATRDERFYDEPDASTSTGCRPWPWASGYGIHSCLGAALARMESRIAIEELVRRWPRLRGGRGGIGPGAHVQCRRLRQGPGPPGRLTGRTERSQRPPAGRFAPAGPAGAAGVTTISRRW